MLKLATLLDNPGEPHQESRYRDPAELKRLGYNGLVIYETTGLSGLADPQATGGGEMMQWAEGEFQRIGQTIGRAAAAGLSVYISYDVLVLPRRLVQQDPSLYGCKGGRPGTLCPASEAAMEASSGALAALLERWPGLAGVVLRFGDNDVRRLPHLVGNDLYAPSCPRCARMGKAERIGQVLRRFYDLVVERGGRTLIARAWNVHPGGLHDTPQLCEEVRERLPGKAGDERFIVSFKFTQTDFWRYQPWNASSLLLGERPILYELQCQREFEGKGGIPNWQVPLWRDGPCAEEQVGTSPKGLAQVAQRVKLAGLWAWVRGGGWGGPFVSNESWIDANVVAVPRLAEQPDADAGQLARDWAQQRLGLTGPAVAAVEQVLAHSPRTIREGFYIGPYARLLASHWHANGDVVQDDLIDAQAAWRIVQQLGEEQLEEAVREKQAAADRVGQDRAALQRALNDRNERVLQPLIHTLLYEQSLLETLRDLLEGLVAYRRYRASRDRAAGQRCRQQLLSAQAHWNQHTQRHGALAGAATAFRERGFWDLTQRALEEVSADVGV